MNSLIHQPCAMLRGRMCLVRCPECGGRDYYTPWSPFMPEPFKREIEAAIDKIAQRMVEGDPDGGE